MFLDNVATIQFYLHVQLMYFFILLWINASLHQKFKILTNDTIYNQNGVCKINSWRRL